MSKNTKIFLKVYVDVTVPSLVAAPPLQEKELRAADNKDATPSCSPSS